MTRRIPALVVAVVTMASCPAAFRGTLLTHLNPCPVPETPGQQPSSADQQNGMK